MFDAILGTFEAIIYINNEKKAANPIRSKKMSYIWSNVKQYLLPFE